ncbi:hypothetical protein BGX28_004299 [Mortierella sp. GBA30]|nr:hypothetical protein BGX28_004299 [Mortierella sp. GBA30]
MEAFMSDECYKNLRKTFIANITAVAMGLERHFNILETFGEEFPMMVERIILTETIQDELQGDARRLLPDKVMRSAFDVAEQAFTSIIREAPFWKRRLEPCFNVTFDQFVDVKR